MADYFSHGPSEPPEPENLNAQQNLSSSVAVLRSAVNSFEDYLGEYRWEGNPDGPPEEVPREVYADVVDIAEGLLLDVGAVRTVSAPSEVEVKPPKVCVFQVIVGIAFIGICIAMFDALMR